MRPQYCAGFSFTVFWIYTTLKHVSCIITTRSSFTVFWIYTTLKLHMEPRDAPAGFTVFWIYTTLKLRCGLFQPLTVLLYSEFTLLSNTSLRTILNNFVLLYSEFTLLSNRYLYFLIILKVLLYSEFTLLSNRQFINRGICKCFTVFWIYTTLKL